MAVPLRREPVTAPIVLEASSMSETTKRRRLFRRKKQVMEFQLGERIDPADAVPLVHLDRRPITGPTAVGARARASASDRSCSTRWRSPSRTPR